MELKPYYYKRTLRDTHCGYGTVADGVEKCPIDKVKIIGFACTLQDCCKSHAHFMSITEDSNSWISCEETTKMMENDPLLGQKNTCVVGLSKTD